MGTRIYHVISAHNHEEEEKQGHHEHESRFEGRDGRFEMTAHSHRNKDGKSEVRFEGKMALKNEDYYKYITKYGHHFSKKLAEHLVDDLISSGNKISYDKTEEILKQSDEELDEGHTIADLYYVANVIKARHSNSTTIKSDAHVVMLAVECLNDPNKSEGEVFCEWFDSLKRKNKEITWTNFM